ncbi:MAG: TIGR00725 family protein [Acidobacteriota bacterium]
MFEDERAGGLRTKKRIGIIGGNEADQRLYEIAFEVGKLIAKNDAILICGGLGGVMEAASKGAKSMGGITIGIIPSSNIKDANRYIDIPISTGIGLARNLMVVLNSDVLIAIDGKYGTLSEISYALIFGKRVIGLETWDIEGVKKAHNPEEAIKFALYDHK